MKNFSKSVVFVLYFIVMQCLVGIGFIVLKMWFDTDWSNQIYNCIVSNNLFSMKYLTLVSEAVLPMLIIADIVILIPMLIYCRHKKIRLYQKISGISTLQLISVGLILNLIVSVVIELLPDSLTTSQYDQLTSLALGDSFILTFLSSAILTPIIEELIFRFGICGLAYKEANEKKAIIVSSLLFGLAHMNPIQSTYAFLLGLVLAYVFVKSKNILPSTLMHITINGSSILYEYFNHVAVIIIGLIIVGVTGYESYRKNH